MEKLVLAFPGGGSQYVGMMKSLCKNFQIADETFEEASQILGFDIKHICFESELDVLSEMSFSQPAIFISSMAAFRVYMMEIGIVPSVAIGHSLGEYAALTTAGVLHFEDALKIIQVRGKLLEEVGFRLNAGMLAINKLETAVIEILCQQERDRGKEIYVSVYNSSRQCVLSGIKKDLIDISVKLEKIGAETSMLKIETPSHCPIMKGASEELGKVLSGIEINDFNFPVVANLTGLPYPDKESVREYLIRHLYEPVRWNDSFDYLDQKGILTLLEVGPQSILSKLTKHISEKINSFSMDVMDDRLSFMNQFKIDIPNYKQFLSGCIALPVATINFNYDEDSYRDEVKNSYLDMKSIYQEVKDRGLPSPKILRKMLDLLEHILIGKQMDKQHVKKILNNLIDEASMKTALGLK